MLKFNVAAHVLMWTTLLLCGGEALAIDPAKTTTPYSYDGWLTKDGLPHNAIQKIVQSRDGYLWLGTLAGLVRFDGKRFVIFDKANTGGMKHDSISEIYEDREGSLWVGTYGGLVRRRGSEVTTYTTRDGLAHDIIYAICEDHEGNLWIGTAANKLNRFKDGVFTTYSVEDGLPDDSVKSLYRDRQGHLWIGTNGGHLAQLRDGKFTTVSGAAGSPKEMIKALHDDQEGNLWLGTRSGLVRYRDGKFTSFTTKDGLPSNFIQSIAEDAEGTLWIGTNEGLARFTGNQVKSYTTRDGLSNSKVFAIYEDREGSLWVGTEGGLNRLKESKFMLLTVDAGLSKNYVYVMYEDRAGDFWIGTEDGGLNRVRNGKVTVYTTRDGLSHNTVRAIHEDREGALWVGTEGGGLSRFKNGKFKTYTTKDGLPHDHIFSICEDKAGTLWLGTNGGGLVRFKGGRFTSFTRQNGLPLEKVRAVYADSEGNIWLGSSSDNGLVRLKDGRFTIFTTQDGFPDTKVLSFYEDQDGRLWICTAEGLIALFAGRFIDATQVLNRKSVFHMLEDEQDNLWTNSAEGLVRISKKELREFAEGNRRNVVVESFTKAANINPHDFTNGAQGGAWRTKDGKLWFPTRVGALVVDPTSIRKNLVIPPVHVEQAIINKRKIDPNAHPELLQGQGEIEIGYTALSLLAPEDVRFRYKLEGYDKEWVDAGARRVAYYTNISPGNYRFRVIASNNDGVWNETGDSFSFNLKPHFYQTYWFYAFCTLITGLIGLGIYRLRVKQVEAQYARMMSERIAERTRIAREIHDTLIQGVVATSAQLEAISAIFLDSPEAAKAQLDRVRLLVRRSLDEARRSIWELRPHALDGGNLATALAQIVQQQSAHDIVHMQVVGAPGPLPGIIETNILRIAQEAVANAIKHSRASHIDIELDFKVGYVELRVRDDGRGFETQTQFPSSEHFGLLGMRERAQQIGGEIIISSASDMGTEIVLTVPIH